MNFVFVSSHLVCTVEKHKIIVNMHDVINSMDNNHFLGMKGLDTVRKEKEQN